jgi:hypothetical protein
VVLANGRLKCGVCDFGGSAELVHLVGVSISLEKSFYRLPFTPPLSGRLFGPLVVPQGLVVLFPVVLGGDFRSPLLVFFLGCFRDLALGDLLGGNLWEPFVVLWAVIPLSNP